MTDFKNFRQLREELRMTQLDVAILLGVSRVTYIKWEDDPDTMPIGKYKELIHELEGFKKIRDNKKGD